MLTSFFTFADAGPIPHDEGLGPGPGSAPFGGPGSPLDPLKAMQELISLHKNWSLQSHINKAAQNSPSYFPSQVKTFRTMIMHMLMLSSRVSTRFSTNPKKDPEKLSQFVERDVRIGQNLQVCIIHTA